MSGPVVLAESSLLRPEVPEAVVEAVVCEGSPLFKRR